MTNITWISDAYQEKTEKNTGVQDGKKYIVVSDQTGGGLGVRRE